METAGHATTRECDRRTGLLSKETQINGLNAAYDITRRWAYDALNRMSSVTDWLSRATRYSYDAAGNRVTEARLTSDLGISYDADGLVAGHEDADHANSLCTKRAASAAPMAMAAMIAPVKPFTFMPGTKRSLIIRITAATIR